MWVLSSMLKTLYLKYSFYIRTFSNFIKCNIMLTSSYLFSKDVIGTQCDAWNLK